MTKRDAIFGWTATGESPGDYDFELDATGRKSAFLRARTATPGGFGTLMQSFVPVDFRGRRVRLSGALRSAGVVGSCKLWMRVDLRGRSQAFGQSPLVTGTTDWTPYQVVLDVDIDADVLAFGVLLADGAGTAWLSDVKLEVVGTDVPTTAEPAKALPNGPLNLGFDA